MEEYETHKLDMISKRAFYKSQIDTVSHQVEMMLDTFSSDRQHTLVSWEQMKSVKLNEEFIVNSKVKFIKYYQDNKTMKFTNYLKAGGVYGFQKHDCVEVVTIIDGSLIECKRDNKEYKKGDIIVYKPFELHKPSTKEISVYNVEFSKLNCIENGEVKCILNKIKEKK